MSQPKFRKNQTTGRLEKLIDGKYTPQKEMGFWDWDSKEGRKRNRNNPLRIIRDTIRNVNYEKKRRKKLEDKNSSNKSRVTNEKDTGPTKLVKGEDGKVTRVRVSDNKNRKQLTFLQGAKAMESTKKGSTTKDDGGKAAWLKKTRNSPAAKSGAFSEDDRLKLQQKHLKWKASRGKK